MTHVVPALQNYLTLVDFLGNAFGDSVEVVLHDISLPEAPIAAIANGHISRRKVGQPANEKTWSYIQRGMESSISSLSGYRTVDSAGRVFRTSCLFIRNEVNELIAMLSINADITEINRIEKSVRTVLKALGCVTHGENSAGDQEQVTTHVDESTCFTETTQSTSTTPLKRLRSDLDALSASMLDTAIARQDLPIASMGPEDRYRVVSNLEEAGFFLLKGGIASAAARLNVSEPTVYRYLMKVRGGLRAG